MAKKVRLPQGISVLESKLNLVLRTLTHQGLEEAGVFVKEVSRGQVSQFPPEGLQELYLW